MIPDKQTVIDKRAHSTQFLGVLFAVCSAIATGQQIPPQAAATSQQATRIVVKKSDRTLTVYHGETKLQVYKVSLGSTTGAKQQAGDRKTPEGSYIVDRKIEKSQFHHAFHISYPNAQDRERAKKAGQNPGGDIEIHGQKNSLAWMGSLASHFDWTAGCIALTNDQIDILWPIVPIGTPVQIEP